jgi:lysozyme
MKPSDTCTRLIQKFEGCERKRPDGSFEAYPDPGTGGDPWTIGWGSTGADIKPETVWSQAQCDARFGDHVAEFAEGVASALGGAKTSQAQFDAMVCFAYNVGLPNFRSSSLLRKHKAGDFAGAAAEFAKWNKANKKVMAGLTRRRAAESALYGQGIG